jgi:hypothetical protein
MKTTETKHLSAGRVASLLSFFVLLAGMNFGCGKKGADAAAVAPAPVSNNPIGARGGPPEADAYRAKMGANAKAPGAR